MKHSIKKTMGPITALALLVLPGLTFTQDPKPFVSKHKGVPVLLIERVEQIDNLDQGDIIGKNRADFFAVVSINGVENKTEVYAEDDAHPYWEIPLDMRSRYSNIVICIMEDDGGLERKDDHVDVSPKPRNKDIRLRYDRFTGRVSGEVNGQMGQRFILEGKGDDDVARITFKIHKAM